MASTISAPSSNPLQQFGDWFGGLLQSTQQPFSPGGMAYSNPYTPSPQGNASVNTGNGTAYIPGQGYISTQGLSSSGPSYNPQTLGASTGGTAPAPAPTSTTTDTGTVATPNYDALQQQINANADQGLAALDPQRASQEGIVNNNYNQGVSDLNFQQQQGQNALDTTSRHVNENQVKTLGDLTENLRNMFQAGNTYLGARGAGDSSAANQYAYAIAQQGNKNRGNVMSQTASIQNDIADRSNQLHQTVQQGVQQLNTQKANALQGIAQWYADAQNQIRNTKGQNLVALGQQALSNAINAINQINSDHQSRLNSLMTWAENNATNIAGLKSNMAQVATMNPTMPTSGAIPSLATTPGSVNNTGTYTPGSNSTQKTYNPITGQYE